MGGILVCNAGSSSIKFALFDRHLQRLLSGMASEIGRAGDLEIGGEKKPASFANHAAAVEAILLALQHRGVDPRALSGAAHRVVHGGRDLVEPCRLTAGAIERIEACAPLAPLHNPHNLTVIRALARIAPELQQYASFDTAFHATNPEVARRYAIPAAEDAKDIRRYGFHGISYAGLVESLPRLSGCALPERLLALHLGNGASLCAIKNGRSAATTMGYSPLDGLTMGTRCGAIDGNAVLRMASEHGIDEAARILNHGSGLKGLAGHSDMRALHAAETPEADFALRHFAYWAVRHAGSMIAAMGGLDALAFTGGIGENDAWMRARIMEELAWLGLRFDRARNMASACSLHAEGSTVKAWIVPADEERTIAGDAAALIAQL